MHRLKILDLFAGVSGISLGFEYVRTSKGIKPFELFCAVDSDKHCCETIRKNFNEKLGKDVIVIQGDITERKVRQEIIEKCKDRVDIVVGGLPCQSFSLIGPRSGFGKSMKKFRNDRRDKFYRHYFKIVKGIMPKFIVVENVRGILSKCDKHKRKYIDRMIADFKSIGFAFDNENHNLKTEYMLLNAADYGVPQRRERVFLIGNRLGLQNPFPVPTHEKHKVTLRDAIGDLPKLKSKLTDVLVKKNIFSGTDIVQYQNSQFKRHYANANEYAKYFLSLISMDSIRQINKNSEIEEILTHHMSRSHQSSDVMLYRKLRPGMTSEDVFNSNIPSLMALRKLIKYDMSSFSDKYRKQSWNAPSTTLFAHLSKDGNRFIHPDSAQARTITPREAARLQSFPDWFEFSGPMTQKFRQIGNAVPPLLSKAIAESIARTIM